MEQKANMFLINVFFLIATIIAFVRFLFFQDSLVWLCIILIVWIGLLISIERVRRENDHERPYKRRRKRVYLVL